MKRILLVVMVAAVLFGGGWVVNDRANFDRSGWLADFEQLTSATEQSYANLRWSRSSKNADLVTLHANALEELRQATSNSAARGAITKFIRGFNDGHFRIESAPPRPIAAALKLFERDEPIAVQFHVPGRTTCRALGFSTVTYELAIEGAAPLAGANFAAGTVRTTRGRTFGIIRIPLFQQREYGAVCERAWDEFRKGKSGACEESCQDDFSIHAKHEIAQALADDANALLEQGAEAVVVDLTGNGGGTEWAEFAAAALSATPLRAQPVAFVRGQHWIRYFDAELATLAAEVKTARDSARVAELHAERAALLAMRDSATRSCSLKRVWTERAAQPDCWNDVRLLDGASTGKSPQYARPYKGALYIMTDARTASASEQFAALLVDNGVAKTIGEPTMGIGCGYTNGGNPTRLKHSGLVIWMPDCVRLRADGSNEFEGIAPHYPTVWGNDAAGRAAALRAALDKLPRR